MVDKHLPPRMFSDRSSGQNQKVITYSKLWWISAVAGALDPPELHRLKASPLGKLFEFPTKFTFSGTFVHYILKKMLRTKKKHELWFLFAGKPWRFSLREFGIVTGLHCGSVQPLPKVKGETEYWNTLFPSDKQISVTWVLKELQKGSPSLSSDMRIRYAALLLVDGILCSYSHQTMISRDHVELIQDLDAFLSYPWGTVSFQTTINSIKTKARMLGMSSSMSVQGFLLPLQLVAFEAIPAISDTFAEGDGAQSEPEARKFQLPTNGIRLKDVKNVELQVEVEVVSRIEGGDPHGYDPDDWVDIEDDKVEHMLGLIEDDFHFDESVWPLLEVSPNVAKVEVKREKSSAVGDKKIKKVSLSNKRKRASRDVLSSSESDRESSGDSEDDKYSHKRKRKYVLSKRRKKASHVVLSSSDSGTESSAHSSRCRTKAREPVDVRSISDKVGKVVKSQLSLAMKEYDALWEGRFQRLESLIVSNKSCPTCSAKDKNESKGKTRSCSTLEPAKKKAKVTGNNKELAKKKETPAKPVSVDQNLVTKRLTRSSAAILGLKPSTKVVNVIPVKHKSKVQLVSCSDDDAPEHVTAVTGGCKDSMNSVEDITSDPQNGSDGGQAFQGLCNSTEDIPQKVTDVTEGGKDSTKTAEDSTKEAQIGTEGRGGPQGMLHSAEAQYDSDDVTGGILDSIKSSFVPPEGNVGILEDQVETVSAPSELDRNCPLADDAALLQNLANMQHSQNSDREHPQPDATSNMNENSAPNDFSSEMGSTSNKKVDTSTNDHSDGKEKEAVSSDVPAATVFSVSHKL